MSDLPKGWEWKTLGELGAPEPRSITDGPFGSNLKTAHYTDSGPRVIRLQNIGLGEFIDEEAHISPERFERLRDHEARAGDLIVASLTQGVVRSCVVPASLGPAIVKADCIRVRLDEAFVPAYVNYALQRPDLNRVVAEQIHGVGRPRLGMSGIKALEVPVPPKPEQERIVAAIEERLSLLDAARKAVETGKRRVLVLQQRVLRDLFADAQWPWTTLGVIAEIKGGVTKDTKRQSDPELVEVPYLRVANVQRGRLDLREVTRIRVQAAKAEALRLHEGDVLFNEGGDRDKLGRGWVWEGQIPNCIHQNHVFRARLENGPFNPYFVSTHANTWGQAWFERNGRQTTNLASISMRLLKQLPVPAPPLEAQSAIVAELDRLTTGVESLDRQIERCEARAASLGQSILAAAFSGRLVPQ